MTDQEEIKVLMRWAGFTFGVFDCDHKPQCLKITGPGGEIQPVATMPDFLHSFDAHIKWTIPKSGMDVLWIVNNLDSPLPQIQYVFGFTRGEDNDLVCWSRDLPPEECLSPVCDEPALACLKALLALIRSKNP